VAPRAGLPEPNSFNALDWQTALSALIGSKSIFGALANLRWDYDVEHGFLVGYSQHKSQYGRRGPFGRCVRPRKRAMMLCSLSRKRVNIARRKGYEA